MRQPRPTRRRARHRVRSRQTRSVVAAGLLAALPLLGAVTAAHGDAAAAPSLTCKPWQTPTAVPPGPTGSPRPGATTPARPVPTRTVCRNAPPTPFPAPSWVPDSVVGGSRLAASGLVVDLPAGVPAPPPVLDVSYVLADLDTGQVLAAKSPHAWLRPASTLKTLTALTLLPALDPRAVVVATTEHEKANGTRVGMVAGNRYPVGSLFDALLMFSANDAAYALADAAGGYEHTVTMMNAKAAEVGAHDTVVVDPSGLDEDGQRTSAYDLAVIGRDAMRLPAFRTYVTKRDAVFPGGRDARTGAVYPAFHIYNINDLLGHYPGAIGVKPGRTNRAQHTFIGAATRGGRTLIVAQMGSTTGSWKPTAALLDWGFANADRVTSVGHLVEPGEAAAPQPAPSITALPTHDAAGVARPTGTPVPVPTTADPLSVGAEAAVLGGVLALSGGLALAVVRARTRRT